ncbi:MAG: DUF3488 and transglutaminase-like domain-containing protein [Lachnospiraceae bacterium]|nr:DUF3488 and transglutaminase-like domain-containing protein [Lachnospiraceae bacterium]
MIAFIYDLIYVLPMCVAVTLMCAQDDPDRKVWLYLLAVTAGTVFTLFFHLKARGRAVSAGVFIICAAASVLIGGRDFLYENIWTANVAIVCLICFVVYTAVSIDVRLKAALPAIGMIVMLVQMFTKHRTDKGVFVCIVFMALIAVAELVQSRWKKEKDADEKRYIAYILPVFIAALIPVMMTKIPNRPFDWGFVRNIAEACRDGLAAVIETFSPEEGWDGGDSIGFSEKASIGGVLRENPYRALAIESSSPNDHRVYLAGKSFDTFSGRKWEKMDTSETDYKAYDLIESTAAVMQHYPDEKSELIKNVRMRVRYEGVRTKYAFVPFKAAGTTEDMTLSGGDLKLPRGRKSDYFVNYSRMNISDDRMKIILDEEKPIDRESFDTATKELAGIVKSECTYEGYETYLKEVYEHYLQPVELSEAAEKYAEDLLDGAGSDYEKLLRIEKALSSYGYTTSPGDLPDSVQSAADYIDYLLFEKQEGYCSYFATAFVLLARYQGIPARYVQGYSTLASVNDFIVMSDRAHAWPEAYIDGVGWVVFEPTPGYRQDAGWDATSVGQTADHGSSYHTLYNKDHGNENDELSQETPLTKDRDYGWIGYLILSVIAFLLIFALADIMYRLHAYRHMDDADKIRTVCDRNMKLLGIMGLKKMPYETLREYEKRAREKIPDHLLRFIGPYEQILYSRSCEPDVADMEECQKELALYILHTLGRFSRLFARSSSVGM